jgi:hypothetical protein
MDLQKRTSAPDVQPRGMEVGCSRSPGENLETGAGAGIQKYGRS